MIKTAEELYLQDQEFRDHISTVDSMGKRVWVYPTKPSGKYHNWRILTTIILLAILFAIPLIKVDGHPFMLFNFFDRQFIIFGAAFWPQDFYLFLLATIAFFIFIILFTVVFGRIWCGWACPQTIFMEMVFRKIEYWIEGGASEQRKLDKQPWHTGKALKKGVKQFIFILISMLIAHTLMAYLVGVDRVKELVSSPPSENMAGFIGLVLFTVLFYLIFAFFREQACVVVCPYGRLQGVLLGKNSIVVAYDWLRGEPRAKLKKGQVQENHGDCIACKRCVYICPTGIDIRNGTQLECINCTACMDACDEVMEKIGRPKGLVRLASYESIEQGTRKLFTPRVAGYSAALALILGILVYLLATRIDVETTVLRSPGMLYQEQPNGTISNLYNITFINKTFGEMSLNLSIKEVGGQIKRLGAQQIQLQSNSSTEGIFMVEFPRDRIKQSRNRITVQVFRNGDLLDEVKTNFMGPFN
jgi:cytochrome c oxidase accessory protein FixG